METLLAQGTNEFQKQSLLVKEKAGTEMMAKSMYTIVKRGEIFCGI